MREQEKLNPVVGVQKTHRYLLTKRNPKPALAGRHYPSIKRLPSEEEIFDPILGKTRYIRFALGETSIYKDEQPPKVVLGNILFQNGKLNVPYTSPGLIEFLTLSNHNADNPHRKAGKIRIFAEINKAKDAEIELAKEEVLARAKALVFSLPFEDLKGYARVCGVNLQQSPAEIKHHMLVLATKDPEGWMAGLDDPMTKRQQIVMDAASCGVIEISGKGAFWKFGDEKNIITPIPTGKDGILWFTEWTMTDPEGEAVYKEIEKKTQKLLS